MLADEAAVFQELVVPIPDHTALLLLPGGNENILDLPTTSLYITVLNDSNSTKCPRKAAVGRTIPTTLKAHPDNWAKLLKEAQLCGRKGNTNLRSVGHVANTTANWYTSYYLLYATLGAQQKQMTNSANLAR